MAEITVENKTCAACGAEERPDTEFCYNCGKSLASETVGAARNEAPVSDDRFSENSVEDKNNGQSATGGAAAVKKTLDQPVNKPVLSGEPKLKSAAAMRRQTKVFQPKKIEVIWEEYDAPNGWFILAAILLASFAGAVFYLAVYLK